MNKSSQHMQSTNTQSDESQPSQDKKKMPRRKYAHKHNSAGVVYWMEGMGSVLRPRQHSIGYMGD